MCDLLNTHSPALRDSMLASAKSKLSVNELDGVFVSVDEVHKAVSSLKKKQKIR